MIDLIVKGDQSIDRLRDGLAGWLTRWGAWVREEIDRMINLLGGECGEIEDYGGRFPT